MHLSLTVTVTLNLLLPSLFQKNNSLKCFEMTMTADDVLAQVKKLLPHRLSKTQETIFREAWEGRSYQEIACQAGYDPAYVKDAGSKLWQGLSKALGRKITKTNFRLVLQSWFCQQVPAAHPAQQQVQQPIPQARPNLNMNSLPSQHIHSGLTKY
jgi:DNA-binding CsgD family transcriptional regulator